ncbi:MAG: AAA family ATPase [Ruminococcus sp.]|nr:AAA family ATPase [Ruminococcus sp.]
MNIKQAGEQIRYTVRAYLARDEAGRYLIPSYKQRPLLLIGPPGIGKTEIMSQIASELGIGLLSYSMTHHTRQSAIGLPMIKQTEYRGESFDITEYTMSEILASVYELMKNTGMEQGILFLDEINCISETLMPIMLQFLQYKVFGGHKLPEGWIVVTAGNPPECNRSVREFDIVTCDRMKILEIEPDFEVWKEYARKAGVHSAVVTYLEIKPGNFYRIESTAGEKKYITARGWDDLGRMLTVCEKLGIPADAQLVRQYIRIDKAADDFALYYELYNKYRSDYRITAILAGERDEEISRRAKDAAFDERYSLLGLLLDAVRLGTAEVSDREALLGRVREQLSEIGSKCAEGGSADTLLEAAAEKCRAERARLAAAGSLSERTDRLLSDEAQLLSGFRLPAAESGFDGVKAEYESLLTDFKAQVGRVKQSYSNMFGFCTETFGEGRELLILVTELAADPVCAAFIAEYGCEEYYRYDSKLMFYEHRLELLQEIDELTKAPGI